MDVILIVGTAILAVIVVYCAFKLLASMIKTILFMALIAIALYALSLLWGVSIPAVLTEAKQWLFDTIRGMLPW